MKPYIIGLVMLFFISPAFADCLESYNSCLISCCNNAEGELTYVDGEPSCSGYGQLSKDKYYSCVSETCYPSALACVGSYGCASEHAACISKCRGEMGSGVASCYESCDTIADTCFTEFVDSKQATPQGG
ncbi:MAG: hypothetical protein N3G76_01855, partial [Candidatus Micrarchaeota archaeon]|nr:hypothetical protein [Candidatus Micrarchaeota archaeon]